MESASFSKCLVLKVTVWFTPFPPFVSSFWRWNKCFWLSHFWKGQQFCDWRLDICQFPLRRRWKPRENLPCCRHFLGLIVFLFCSLNRKCESLSFFCQTADNVRGEAWIYIYNVIPLILHDISVFPYALKTKPCFMERLLLYRQAKVHLCDFNCCLEGFFDAIIVTAEPYKSHWSWLSHS